MRAFTPLAAALLAGCIAVPAFAASQGGSLAERYERARHVLEEQQAAEAKSEAEHTRLAREAEDLRNRLIANAARVQQLETQLTDTETELARLSQLAQALEIDFHRNREKVGHLLAVLQRLDADEPPAIAMRPNDSLAAVRGAMILGTMIPPIYAKTADLARSLQTLRATKSALEKKRAEAQATSDELMKARGQLAVLLDQRNLEAQSAQSQLAELHAVTEQAAKETGDLKSLIDKIAMLRAQTGVTSMTVVTAENAGAGHASAGHLRPPVAGRMLRGGPDSPNPIKGAESPGLWFLGSSSAQAVAPADSEVVFAGPYQRFGQVLILEIAGGYDLLLAGLARINVHIGDSVLAGEPVGTLGETQPHLYMELRRGGQTINPAPWLAAESRKAKRS